MKYNPILILVFGILIGNSSTTRGITCGPAPNKPDSAEIQKWRDCIHPGWGTQTKMTFHKTAGTIITKVGGPPSSSPPPRDKPSKTQIVTLGTQVAITRKTFARFKTTLGDFVCLLESQAPQAELDFLDLASGKKQWISTSDHKKKKTPYYTGLLFFNTEPNIVIESGGPGIPLNRGTAPDKLHFDRAGIIAMLSGSQFVVTLAPTPRFEGKAVIIGHVASGLEVVKKISRAPRNTVKIKSVSIFHE